MNKNTGDGELDEDELCRLASLVGTDARNPEANLVAYVRGAIAQEANKAQQQLLKGLIRQWQQFNEYDPETLSNVPVNAVRLEVIQNKLEGLS